MVSEGDSKATNSSSLSSGTGRSSVKASIEAAVPMYLGIIDLLRLLSRSITLHRFRKEKRAVRRELSFNRVWQAIFAKYLSGVFAAEEFEEKQPTNLGMLVADVDLINSLGRGVM